MQSFVAVSRTSSIVETDEDVSENFQSDAKVFSKMQINNLEYLIISREKKFKVIAYISKESYSVVVTNFKNEIIEMIRVAEEIEKNKNITFAIKQYYLAYLKTFYSVEPIQFTSSISQKKYSSIQPYLKSKIELFLQDCKIIPQIPTKDLKHSEIIVVQFDLNYKSLPINDVCVSLDKKQFYKINDGKTTINLEKFPSNLTETYLVIIAIQFDELTDPNELLDIHKQYSIQKEKEVKINFSDIININFDYSIKNKIFSDKPNVKFTPQIEYLSPFHIEWSFGDNTFSSELNPTHQYENGNEFEVSLIINKNPNLTVTKQINIMDEDKDIFGKSEKQIINKLSKIKSYKELMKNLSVLKSEGKLIYGNENDFKNPEECYIIIIDIQLEEVIAILEKKKNNHRYEILSKTSISSLKKFKGKGAKWVKIIDGAKK